jgi:hypothetical protein
MRPSHHSHALVVYKHSTAEALPSLEIGYRAKQLPPCLVFRIDGITIIDEVISAARHKSQAIFMSVNSAAPKSGVRVGNVL